MDKYLHWYEAFWGKAQKQIHEGLGPKWTISYHCGDMWCPESLHIPGLASLPDMASSANPFNPIQNNIISNIVPHHCITKFDSWLIGKILSQQPEVAGSTHKILGVGLNGLVCHPHAMCQAPRLTVVFQLYLVSCGTTEHFLFTNTYVHGLRLTTCPT